MIAAGCAAAAEREQRAGAPVAEDQQQQQQHLRGRAAAQLRPLQAQQQREAAQPVRRLRLSCQQGHAATSLR